MKPLVINPDCADKVVGHSNISKTVGNHTQDELVLLGIQARQANNPLLINCFKDLPTLDVLLAAKTDAEVAAIPAAPAADDSKKK